jgi:choline dehydrogenase
MRQYFKRLERCEYLPTDAPGHGFDGWLGTNRADLKLALKDFKILSIIGAAAAAMGNRILSVIHEKVSQLLGLLLRDVNSVDARRDMTEGIYQLPLAVSRAKRSGTRDLVLNTAKEFPLEIRTCCLATRVRFEEAVAPTPLRERLGSSSSKGAVYIRPILGPVHPPPAPNVAFSSLERSYSQRELSAPRSFSS